MDDFPSQLVAAIPYLRRYARLLTGRPDTADDLVQDCLVRALRYQSSFSPGTDLRAWCFKIQYNLFIDQLRSRARRPEHESLNERDHLMASRSDPFQAVELQEVERILRRLPVAQRQVLLLIAFEGFSYDEAAEILSLPVGTVKSRLFRARRGLFDAMEKSVQAKPKD